MATTGKMIPLPKGWTVHSRREVHFGRPYFYFADTGESTWDPPPPPPPPPSSPVKCSTTSFAPESESESAGGGERATKEYQDREMSRAKEKANVEVHVDAVDRQRNETAERNRASFARLLQSMDIQPYSQWEKWMPMLREKIEYRAVDNHEDRRAVFSQCKKQAIAQERADRKAARKSASSLRKWLLASGSIKGAAAALFHSQCTSETVIAGIENPELVKGWNPKAKRCALLCDSLKRLRRKVADEVVREQAKKMTK